MIRILFFLVMGLFIFSTDLCFAEVTRTSRYFCVELCNADTNQGDRYEYLFQKEGQPIARQVSKFYANGPVIEESGAIPDGPVMERDVQNAQVIEMHYRNNRLQGPMRFFDLEGNFRWEQYFEVGAISKQKEPVCDSDEECVAVHSYWEARGDGPQENLVACRHKDHVMKEGEVLADPYWHQQCSCLKSEKRCKRLTEE